MKSFRIAFAALAALCCALVASGANQVRVGLYYETYCPDCKVFVAKQLWPTYLSIGEIMDIDLIPSGFMTHRKEPDGNIVFTCQHGPKECAVNMIHACVVNLIKTDPMMRFVNCMETKPDPLNYGPSCAKEAGFDYKPITECLSNGDGVKYLIAAENKTYSYEPNIDWVPWVTINSVHSSAAETRLKSTICQAYQGTKPANCTN